MPEEYISGEQHREMKQSRNTKKVTLRVSNLTIVAIVVVLCFISFFAGAAYGKHSSKASQVAVSSNGTGTGFTRGFAGNRGSMGFGTVTSISSSSITITNRRTNAAATYTITSSTAITDNGQSVSVSSIQTGDTVIISTSSSNSKTATRILVNPSFGGGFGGGAAGGSGSSTTGSNSTSTGSQSTN